MSKYHDPKNNFTKVPNCVILDPELTPLAKVLFFIFAVLLSIPNFYPAAPVLRRCSGRGKSVVSDAVAELRKHGYLEEYHSTEGGKKAWGYVLHSSPLPPTERSCGVIKTNQVPPSRYIEPDTRYTAISDDILLCGGLEPAHKVLYCHLACYANAENYVLRTWAIAKDFGVGEDTIQKYIRVLRELGLVDREQMRDEGRLGAMSYTVFSSSPKIHSNLSPTDEAETETTGHETTGHETTGHETTGHETTGHETTGHETTGHGTTGPLTNPSPKDPYLKDPSSSKPTINQGMPLSGCPEEILTICDWLKDRYPDEREQEIYNLVVQGIARLYRGHTSFAAIITGHLCRDDFTLCQLVDEVTGDCFDHIYYPEDGNVVDNPGGYITAAVKNRLSELAERDREKGVPNHVNHEG